MKSANGELTSGVQLSVFLVNKPGVLARVCQQLATARVNILGLSMMDSTEHGVLRFVAEDPADARAALAALDVPITETTVLIVNLPHRQGALADVVERLAASHINVNYAYITTGAAGGKTLGIFRVSDLTKAMRVLAERKPRRKDTMPAVRTQARRARQR